VASIITSAGKKVAVVAGEEEEAEACVADRDSTADDDGDDDGECGMGSSRIPLFCNRSMRAVTIENLPCAKNELFSPIYTTAQNFAQKLTKNFVLVKNETNHHSIFGVEVSVRACAHTLLPWVVTGRKMNHSFGPKGLPQPM
jgi:hypothetical protein